MSNTFLSVLSTSQETLEIMSSMFIETKFSEGYVGIENLGCKNFIRTKPDAKHILFLKPSKNFFASANPQTLKKLGNVDVVLLGVELPTDLISFVLENKIVGFVNPLELDIEEVIAITNQITKNGYYANKHIPAEYWINNTCLLYTSPSPRDS